MHGEIEDDASGAVMMLQDVRMSDGVPGTIGFVVGQSGVVS